jgi:hypothetical protein
MIDNNNKILLIIKNKFNILDHFSHIIKKKNIYVDIIIQNIEIIDYMNKQIKDEECEDNINLYYNIKDIEKNNNLNSLDIENKIYNIINIFHLESNEKFEKILQDIYNIIDINTIIYIYSSLSNENENKITYKNYFRNLINNYTELNIGTLLKLSDVIYIIENLKYNIYSVNIYKKNNYILYGNNIVYQIILKKI